MSRRAPRERRETRSCEYTKDVMRSFERSQRRGSYAALMIKRKHRIGNCGGGPLHLRWGETIDRDASTHGEAAGARGETCLWVGPFLQNKERDRF